MTDEERIEFINKIQYCKKQLSAVAEYLYGTDLHWYQKYMLDNLECLSPHPRNQMRKWDMYIRMCCAYIEMKDDDYIVIATPKKVERLSKSEFLKYLKNYWK